MIYLILTSREDNCDYTLVIINKNDFKSLLGKNELSSECYSTEKTKITNTNDMPINYSFANTLETQIIKDNKHSNKNTDIHLISNDKKLRNAEKKILDNFHVRNNENNHNTSHNSNENNKADNNKSNSNCECYNKHFLNNTDNLRDFNNNNNNEKNQGLQIFKISNDNNNDSQNTNILKNAIFKTKLNFFENQNIKMNKKYNENENDKNETEDQNLLLPKILDIEKLNHYKHIYIKNLYLKINSNQSLLTLFVKGFLKATAKPWEMLLDLFTPKSNEGALLIIKFIIPLFFIWNFSEVELFILEKVMSRLKVPASFLGLTIMSWGNNAPDMYNVASAMAKGLVDLALNAAIASEIHNILLGLGLPWLVYNLTYSKPIEFEMNDLYAFTIFFFCVFLLVFMLALKFNRYKFDYKLAVFLILVYLVFLILIFVLSFNIKLW
jgi:Ca2+/Na+ antiporter